MGNSCGAVSEENHDVVLGQKDKNFVPKNAWDEKIV